MTATDQKICKISIAALCVPLAFVLLCVSYILRAKWALGHWPTYGNPDPKQLGWPFHHSLVLLGWLITPVALTLSAVSAFWLIHRRLLRAGLLIVTVAILLSVGLTWLGHTHWGDEFAGWYLD